MRAAIAAAGFFILSKGVTFSMDQAMANRAGGLMFPTLPSKGVFTQHECCVIHLSVTQ